MTDTNSPVTGARGLPSVERILAHPTVQHLTEVYLREVVTNLVRSHLEDVRTSLRQLGGSAPTADEIAQKVADAVSSLGHPSFYRVINATGVIIHTNLGRAPLSADAIEAVRSAAYGYTNLEMSLEEGQRGSRQTHVEHLLRQTTGAEASQVVNNNAAAVLLALVALAKGREVIVSRGEAVEIGGGFRIPDVLHQSGAHLVEVGTTNRTKVADYEQAITENTGALLRVHPSNFRVTGFTHSPTTEELVALGDKHQIPTLYDLGSGCLLDTTRFGLAHEPTPQDSVRAGVTLSFFSGDKLLGGPQAGIVVGKREFIQRLASHPLARAMRIDKISLAALSSTLLHYLKGEAIEKIPVWRMIHRPAILLKVQAKLWVDELGPRAKAVQGFSTIGGGSLPGETLPTWLVTINAQGSKGGVQALAALLRAQEPAIVARIDNDRVVLDPRTVLPEEATELIQGVNRALHQLQNQ